MMVERYLKYFRYIVLATYVLLLHVFSFMYDITNVSQALINLDNTATEIFFHEFLSVMLVALLTTAAIHLPIRLWLQRPKSHEQEIQEEVRNLEKLVSEPNIPRELLGEINMN